MRKQCLGMLCLAISLVRPYLALAQAPEEEELSLAYGDKSFVSIATGSRLPITRAPSVATVITAEDIRASGATDLDEILETVPGLHVARNALLYAPVYVIRGIFSEFNPQILMLQNGVPMTAVYNGDRGVIWGGLPLENVARIEIIRGPGSALYGADAFAGVINIITKTAADAPGTTFGLRGGSFNTWDGWMHYGGEAGSVDIAAYLRVGTTEGFREIIEADNQTRLDAVFGTDVSLAPGPVNTGRNAVDASLDLGYEQWRVRFGYKLRDDVETGAGINAALDPVSKVKSERFTTDLSWNDPLFAPDWGAGIALSYYYYAETTPNRLQLFPPGATFPTGTFPDGMIGGPNRWERQYRFSGFATYSGYEDHSLRFGLGHDDLDLYKTSTFKNFLLSPAGLPIPTGPVIDYSGIQTHILPQTRRVNYFYVQDEWGLARDWTLTAGVRHDSYSDFGDTTNPRLALVWDAAYNVTAKLLAGRAFRAPSFNEQHGINPVASGNPNLRPETIRTTEAAVSWQARQDVQLNFNVFRYDMTDIIRTVPDTPGPGATYQNTGAQTGHGLEMEVNWDVDRNLRLSGNYAYQESIDETTNQDAGNAPRHQLYGRVDWRFNGGWMLSTLVNRVADRRRVAGDTRPQVPDYTTADLTLRSVGSKDRWAFAASVRNLFDADVREPSLFAPALVPGQPTSQIPNDLPMPGRTFYLEARYKL